MIPLVHQFAVLIHVPTCEVVPRGERRPVPGCHPVTCHHQNRKSERHRELSNVRLQLVERHLSAGCLIPGALQFHDTQRQPIDVKDHVKAARVFPIRHRHLVDCQITVLGDVSRNEPYRRCHLLPGLINVSDPAISGDEDGMQPVVLRDRILRLRRQHLCCSLAQVLFRDFWVQIPQCCRHTSVQHNVIPRCSLT